MVESNYDDAIEVVVKKEGNAVKPVAMQDPSLIPSSDGILILQPVEQFSKQHACMHEWSPRSEGKQLISRGAGAHEMMCKYLYTSLARPTKYRPSTYACLALLPRIYGWDVAYTYRLAAKTRGSVRKEQIRRESWFGARKAYSRSIGSFRRMYILLSHSAMYIGLSRSAYRSDTEQMYPSRSNLSER